MDRFFTYRVPPGLNDDLEVGQYVRVPWGKQRAGALVVARRAKPPSRLKPEELKSLLEVAELCPLISAHHWELARWLREFYYGTWHNVLAALVPGPVIQALRKGTKSRKTVEQEGLLEESLIPDLTPSQANVWSELAPQVLSGKTFLLHGVTGSGKTELYLRAAQVALDQGRQVLVLVPEVSLTPQAQARYRARLGDQVSILHSGLTPAQRRAQWWRIRRGEAAVVVGTRSAVFAPLDRLGLIIVDEEHDGSYKQGNDLRYHARQVAAWLSRRLEATVILGSATPSLESYALARRGTYQLLSLPKRVHDRPMPPVRVMKGFGLPGSVIAALEERRTRGEQCVVLLNRRGFSRYLLCHECGWVPECPNCSISLTFHKADTALRCHYCGASAKAPAACGECGGINLDFPGSGTERVERDLALRLPQLRVARLDRDTVGSKARVFEETFAAFEARQLDCLLGTQMVAKGLDFPAVSLVVVLDADTGLHLPDFRASERTFALLTQVAGRAGRGEAPGEVLLVCRRPEVPLFGLVANYQWEQFMAQEMSLRQQLSYPPYCRLLRLLVSHNKAEGAERAALELAERISPHLESGRVEMVGPAPCPVEKLKTRYRWHILLKGKRVQDLQQVVRKSIGSHEARGVRLSIDPDPLELL